MTPIVKAVTQRATLGEGPHWDAKAQCLYYVDIFGQTIHKYVPSTNTHTKARIDEGTVAFIIPVDGKKDTFIVGIGRKIASVIWNGTSEKVLKIEILTELDTEPDNLNNRINDAKCDPAGRLWAGTMGPEPEIGKLEHEKGSLFTLIGKTGIKKHLSKVSISNGLAWNTKLKKMYYIDSPLKTIDEYDYDITKGEMSNKKVAFDFVKNGVPGIPDGMTIDSNGNLWVAVFSGARIIQINPTTSELLKTIQFPADQITSIAFGGPKLDVMYVTSAQLPVAGKGHAEPAGAVFKITNSGATGLAGDNFKFVS